MVEVRQLRHLLAVAEHGNFHRAARAVHLSQPALTKSIQQLERQFGATLFDRTGRRVEPTPMIDVVVMCVVDTGTAKTVAVVTMTLDATVWAANPPAGVSWMIRRPIVRMIRKPPA